MTKYLTLILCCISLTGCASIVSSSIYPALKNSSPSNARSNNLPNKFIEKTLARDDGGKRTYFHWRNTNAKKGTIVYLHGNGATAEQILPSLTFLTSAGFSVAVLEYTGYGATSGHPSEAELLKDVHAIVSEINSVNGNHPVLLMGSSLGGSLAIIAATKEDVDGLITIAAFTKVSDLAPTWAKRYIEVKNTYNAQKSAREISIPWVILHCIDDPTIPSSMANKLFSESLKNPNSHKFIKRYIPKCNTHTVPFSYWTEAIKMISPQL